ncbi:MAG: hypothetical protein M3228_01775 [Actinomycetota bacterium]|nr:hypothetical protein [Actinomycetota bacterium]
MGAAMPVGGVAGEIKMPPRLTGTARFGMGQCEAELKLAPSGQVLAAGAGMASPRPIMRADKLNMPALNTPALNMPALNMPALNTPALNRFMGARAYRYNALPESFSGALEKRAVHHETFLARRHAKFAIAE